MPLAVLRPVYVPCRSVNFEEAFEGQTRRGDGGRAQARCPWSMVAQEIFLDASSPWLSSWFMQEIKKSCAAGAFPP